MKDLHRDRLHALKNFLTRNCSASEVSAIIQWLNSEEAKVYLAKKFEDEKEERDLDFDSEKVFAEILDTVQSSDLASSILNQLEDEGKHIKMLPTRGLSRIKESVAFVAASVAVILLTFLGGYYTNYISNVAPTPADGLTTAKTTEIGQKLSFYLSDGTLVKLNSNSSLRYPVEYAEEKREVWLSGEAYFEVTENPDKPFTVHTTQISTTALGTSFTIRAVGQHPEEVFLISGKVDVILKADPLKHQILSAGQSTAFNGEKSDFEVGQFDPNYHTAWKDGVLAFEESPYQEVVDKLESWYGVSIRVEGEIPENLYSSSKFDNDYFLEVMKSLAYSWDFDYQLDEAKKIVTIEFRK